MRTRIFAVALTVCIPAVMLAQRGGGGGGGSSSGGSGSSGGGSSSAMKSPSSRDFSDLNPASLLIDKKKKASLADSTVAQLKAVEKVINGRNAAFFVAYDSVRKWTVPLTASSAIAQGAGMHGGVGDQALATSTSSAAEQAQMQSAARELRKMMAEYRDRHKADEADALAVVPDAQKKAATDLLSSQDGDLNKLIGKP